LTPLHYSYFNNFDHCFEIQYNRYAENTIFASPPIHLIDF